MNLAPDELNALEAAKSQGFLIRSGKRLAVLKAWREWCRSVGRRCIVGIVGTRQGSIEVDGKTVERVPVQCLEEALRATSRTAKRARPEYTAS